VLKNVIVYRLASPWTWAQADLEAALQPEQFIPCGVSQEKSVGWVSPRGEAHGPLLEVVAGQWLLRLMVEQKSVPGAVVKRKVQEQLVEIERSSGRKPGRKEVRELRDEARHALLPMAFTKQSSAGVWLDPAEGWLVVDAGSQTRADEVMTALLKAIPGLVASHVNTRMSPATAMAQWLSERESPSGFSVDRECELKAADESKAVVRYTRHPLDTEEISQHIAQGKMPTRLALTWNDRVSFVLTDALQLKKLSFLEAVFDQAPNTAGHTDADDFDTTATIWTGELAQMIPDLLDALGGELLPELG